MHYFRSNNTNLKFSRHFLENGHAFRKMGDVEEIKYFTWEGAHTDSILKLFVCKENKTGLKQQNTFSYNDIF